MPFRSLPLCIAASVVVGSVPHAMAQPAASPALPPLASPAGQPATVQPAAGQPPALVGRIAAVTGQVSFHLAGATEWQVASPNLPVTDGTALWVAAGGEAALGIGDGNRIVLGPITEFDVDHLDEQALAATQPQGESYLHLRLVQPGETFAVTTPRGIVTIATAGRYEIVSGDTEHPTTITVLDGAATLSGIPQTAEIGANQTLTITGDGAATTPFTPSIGPAVQDAFLKHVLAEERPPPARPAHAPAIIAQMTGAEALYDVGEWSENAEYGAVWYPPVASYVPYRQGRWAYVAPWGWTWVDDAPWGFAPTHYGRWSQFDGRWGWVPGRDWAPDRRPVYAPALVGFLGGAAVGYGRGPSVGWAPLGPRDTYRPPYRVDNRIIQVLNQPTGANIQITNAPVTINRSAITIVPAQVLTSSAQVASAIRPGPLPPSIGRAPVLQFRPPAAPTRATIGATQAILRQVNPQGLTAPPAHVAPGPGREFGGAPRPQIGPASLLGGAAAGAVAGGLQRPPPPREAGLPELRGRGAPPPGAPGGPGRPGAPGGPGRPGEPERQPPMATVPGPARPIPPVAPAAPVGRPGIPPDRRPELPNGAPRGPDAARPERFEAPRPGQNAPPRPEPGAAPRQDQVAPPRPEPGMPPRPEQAAPPRREPAAEPRPEQVAPPRREPMPEPRREQAPPPRPERIEMPRSAPPPERPAPPQMQRVAPPERAQPERAPPERAPHGPPHEEREGRPQR